MVFKQVILADPVAHRESLAFAGIDIMNSVTQGAGPVSQRVVDTAGRAVPVGVDIRTDNGNAQDAVFEQAKIAFSAIELGLRQGATAMSKFKKTR